MAPINRDEVRDAISEALERAPYGTASTLAAATGVKPQTVSKWKSGEVLAAQGHWRTIEKVLGLPARTLEAAAAQPTTSRESPLTEVLDRLARVEARLARLEERAGFTDGQVREIDEQLEDLHTSMYPLTELTEDFVLPSYDRVTRWRPSSIEQPTLDLRIAAETGVVGELNADDPRGESHRPQPPPVDPDETA